MVVPLQTKNLKLTMINNFPYDKGATKSLSTIRFRTMKFAQIFLRSNFGKSVHCMTAAYRGTSGLVTEQRSLDDISRSFFSSILPNQSNVNPLRLAEELWKACNALSVSLCNNLLSPNPATLESGIASVFVLYEVLVSKELSAVLLQHPQINPRALFSTTFTQILQSNSACSYFLCLLFGNASQVTTRPFFSALTPRRFVSTRQETYCTIWTCHFLTWFQQSSHNFFGVLALNSN